MAIARYALGLCTALVFTFTLVHAGEYDWPQWMGPNRDAVSQETGLLKEWPAEGPPLVWMSREVGFGYAGPAIADGKVFVLGSLDEVTHLIALDEATGDKLWATPIVSDYKNGWGDGPRSTPTVDGDRVYAMTGGGTMICCQVTDGKELWRVSMLDLGGGVPTWGYAESPLVDGDQVICTPGGGEGAMAAFDKLSGKLLWQSADVTEGAQYSSVIKAKVNDSPQYIQLLQKTAFGVDPATGEVIWQHDWPGQVAVIPTPLYRDNKVYLSSGYGVGCELIELGSDGKPADSPYSDRAKKTMKSKHDGLVLVGDYVYGYSDGGGWTCQEFATGKRVWSEKGKLGKGSIGYADGMLYLLDERSGEVVLIDATPDGWQEHGRFTLSPQTEFRNPKGGIWCHPVIANGKLYLRDQELQFCFDVKAK
ncbi:outer membrane biogenesis protein BamB [Aeoliella mucimassa]|uniref:Outer membrane biogenesis protein BamB n=2 Tax=Aeoliella mucimassa TaxID=2527972 RepID=A0A518ALG5_9BACT|nr:outer membrane biogenesis protein BamB [Aeoliella mucimassa]